MNWGNYGSGNGYYYQENVSSSLGNFSSDRMDLIINKVNTVQND